MTITTGYPADETTVYTLVIPRVFGDNGHRRGVTNEQVFSVMSSQKWGLIQGIDCHEKKDFRTGENFRMMFVRWTTFVPPVEVKNAFENDGHIEVDIDDYGHFWKVRKFVPRVKTEVNDKKVSFQGIWEMTRSEFSDDKIAFYDNGLSQYEMNIADELQDSFDLMMTQNTFGDVNEAQNNTIHKKKY